VVGGIVAVLVVVLLAAISNSRRPAARFKPLGRNGQGSEEILWLKDSSVMVRIPAGTFTMGSEEDSGVSSPVHEVYLVEFYIDKHEVTNRQYKRFCDATGRAYPPIKELGSLEDYFIGYPENPVVSVSWDDAAAYCAWAGKRLPTEAEWERAARGADARRYPWGDEEPDAGGVIRANWGGGMDRSAWARDGYDFTSPVGTFPLGASACGCLDMAGNVWEWCRDWFERGYPAQEGSRNPTGPDSNSERVIRGGSWSGPAWLLRCTRRGSLSPWNRNVHRVGFRCAR
jgi:formylglycine-generating enzyme required for sulfatase activity